MPDLAGDEHFDQARRVLVHDVWLGMADGFTTRVHSLSLVKHEGKGFVGDFSATFDGRCLYSGPIRMPNKAMLPLLQRIGAAQAVPGKYTPRREWTDDCPSIQIMIDLGTRFAHLFSSSQGDFHSPWGACIDGELFTLHGDEIGRALAVIRKLVPPEAMAPNARPMEEV